jgi:large subunit ribosomal protein L21
MFAVIQTGGKQYRVAKDDVITVERLTADAGDTVALEQVLMIGGDGQTVVGEPFLSGASVSAEVVEQGRAEKIIVFKKNRRKNYRRTKGHRQLETTLKITDISAKGGKPAAKKAAAPKKEEAKADDAPAAEVSGVAPKSLDGPNGEADDLKKISGVGPKLEEKLNSLGIYHYSQIAEFTPENMAYVDETLNFKGRIERDDWISQAKALMAGDTE